MSHTDTHHSFSIELAIKFGLEKSVIIHNLQHWIKFNRRKKSEKHFKDGKWWTYQTMSDMSATLPYLTEASIKHHIQCLVDQGILIKNNFNKSKIDKTNWYAFADENTYLGPPDSNNVYERGKPPSREENLSPGDENLRPIPDTNSDTKEDILRISKKRKKVAPLPRVEREPGVATTEYEHAKLVELYGPEGVKQRYIAVAAWKGRVGITGGSDFSTIKNWSLKEESPGTKKGVPFNNPTENRVFAKKIVEKHSEAPIEVFDDRIVFVNHGAGKSLEILFTDFSFKERVLERLGRMNLDPDD